MKTNNASIPIAVGNAILKACGSKKSTPLPGAEEKMVQFRFTNEQLINFAESLNQIARQYKIDSTIYAIDVEQCKTVGDCVELVREAIGE